MRGAIGLVALLALGSCAPPEVPPTGQADPPGVVDGDGGRTFADRGTFERYCPLRSTALSEALNARFLPHSVYLSPSVPDGDPPFETEGNMALCRYEATEPTRVVFTAAYQRQASAARARRLSEGNLAAWREQLLPIDATRGSDQGFVRFEDTSVGPWLTLEFVHRDVVIDYVLIGVPQQSGAELVALPRPAPPSL